MKITLAGFNVDTAVSAQLQPSDQVTPEILSAAYARISRSKKNVTELRAEARDEVAQARKSNESIIFEMGHSSVAEHAVFNFDIVGVSRYLVETIQRSRLASFTEKSQRYVTLQGDYVTPQEIAGTPLEEEFAQLIQRQNHLYEQLYERAKQHLDTTDWQGSTRERYGKAKEDARYVLAMATETQLGMTINARCLERLLRRLDASDLAEAHQLKAAMEEQVLPVAPSLIRYTDAEPFTRGLASRLPQIDHLPANHENELLGHSPFPEESILASMLYQQNGYDPVLIKNWVKDRSEEEIIELFDTIFTGMKAYDAAPRAFEIANFTFKLEISSSCFAQLKRHRMSTILPTGYHPSRGYVIPPLLHEIGGEAEIASLMRKVESFFYKLEAVKPSLGSYILTNAHKTGVIFKANLRELYHFSRLRSDSHAQWEIRALSLWMEQQVKAICPNAAKMMMGKDAFGTQQNPLL